jgi:hypothetical protein
MSQYPDHHYTAKSSSILSLQCKALELIFPEKRIFSQYVLYHAQPLRKFSAPPSFSFDDCGYVVSKKGDDFNSFRMGPVKSCFKGVRDQALQESIEPYSESGK